MPERRSTRSEVHVAADETTWVVDRALLIDAMELDPNERAQFDETAGDVLKAVIALVPPEREETPDIQAGPSAGAHLLIPKTRYHLNLASSAKATLVQALQIVGRAYTLDRAQLIEAGITFTITTIQSLLTRLTRLTDEQLSAVTAILDIVRAKREAEVPALVRGDR